MRNQDYSLRSCEAGHEDNHKFGKRLFCGKFHPCNCKCLKCGMIRHTQTVPYTTTLFDTSNAKFCDSGPNKLCVSKDQSSLSAT